MLIKFCHHTYYSIISTLNTQYHYSIRYIQYINNYSHIIVQYTLRYSSIA
jgi:hypothetical protein